MLVDVLRMTVDHEGWRCEAMENIGEQIFSLLVSSGTVEPVLQGGLSVCESTFQKCIK